MAENEALRTWTDDSIWRSGAASWRALRTMRAKPPGAADKGERADVFRAALEQAEQQWTAAGSVGYESRPLNLFYGLSQAGRAIAAAARRLPDSHTAAFPAPKKGAVLPWELSGHGIDVTDERSEPEIPGALHFADITKSNFPEMHLRQKGKTPVAPGNFVRLLSVLSPGCDLSGGVTMGQLWASVLEAVRTRPLTHAWPSVLTLSWPYLLPGRGFKSDLISGATQDARGLTDSEVAALLDHFPTISGYQLEWEPEPGHRPAWRPDGRVFRLGALYWPEQEVDHACLLEARTMEYRGRRVVLPRFGAGDTEPLHPLLTWWAILFGLSMLCRYRPVLWTDLIDINSSTYASAIEHLLTVGLDAVPDLVERTIRQVAT